MMEADASFSCPHCNEVLETRNGKLPKFCSECGDSIEIVSSKPELFCPECSTERTVNSKTGALGKFCSECSYKFLPEGASKTVKVLSSSKVPGTVLATTDGSLETDKCEVQKSAATSVASSVTESKRDSSAGDAPIKSMETNQGLTNLNRKQSPTADIIQKNADVPCKGNRKLKETTCSEKQSDNSIPSLGKLKNFTNNAEANNVEIVNKPDKIPLNEGKPEETVVSKSNLDQNNQVEQTSNLPSALATPSNKTDNVLSSDEDQSETKTTSSSCKVGRKTSTSSDSEEFHDAPDAWHSAESTSTADAGNPVLSKSDVHNSDIRHSIAKSTTEKEAPSLTSTEQGARSTLTSEKDSPSTGFTEKNALTNLTQECSPSIDITGKEVTTRGEEAPSAATTEKKIPSATTRGEEAPSAATTGKKIPSATTTGDETPSATTTKDRLSTSSAITQKGTLSLEMIEEDASSTETKPVFGLKSDPQGPVANGTRSKVGDTPMDASRDLANDLTDIELNVVSSFMELDESLAQLDMLRQDGKVTFKDKEESFVIKALDDFRKRKKDFDKRQGTAIGIEVVNGMRNDFNKWSKKLNTVFERNHLKQTSVQELPRQSTRNPTRATASAANTKQPTQGTKLFTFKAVLSEEVEQSLKLVESKPQLRIHSNRDWKKPVATLELRDGIWTGHLELDSHASIQYKYVLYVNNEKIYEWLGERKYIKGPINRILRVSDKENQNCVIYDGVIQLKPEPTGNVVSQFFKSLKKVFSGPSHKSNESSLAYGYRAMMPDWIASLTGGVTVKELSVQIRAVSSRQYGLFTGFMDLYNDHDYTKKEWAQNFIDHLTADYLLKFLKKQKVLVASSDFVTGSTYASLVGILSTSTFQYTDFSPFKRDTNDYVEVIKLTMAKFPGTNAIGEFRKAISSTDENFFRTLANRLLKIMEHLQSLVLHKHVWIRLIPFLHMLSGEDNIQHQTDNYNSDSWWGVTELRNLVDRNKGFYSTSGQWNAWYTWLKPFFPSMKMLPYTFLALLTADQLVNLLEKADDDAIRCLPLDGVLACALYHLKSSKNKGEIVDKLFGFVHSTKRVLRGLLSSGVSMRAMSEILRQVQPSSSQFVENPLSLGLFSAIGTQLLLLNYQDFDKTEPLLVPLENFCRKLTSVLSNTFYSIYQPTYNTEKLGKCELKIWTALFECSSHCEVDKLEKWWMMMCQESFKRRLHEVSTSSNEVLLVNLYCENDFSITAMEEVTAELALSVAEHVLKCPEAYTASAVPEKIGKLVNRALTSSWDEKDETSMGIVRNVVNWGSFLSVWKFFHTISERQKSTISDLNTERLIQSASAVDFVLNQLLDRSITTKDFEFLYSERDKLLSLCEVTRFNTPQGRESVKSAFAERHRELQLFMEFCRDLQSFWGPCEAHVTERDSVNAWLNRDNSARKVSQLVSLNPDTVVCDCISDRVRHLLKDFNRRKEIHLFFEIYKNKLQKQPLRNLEEVVDIYHESVKEYEKYVQQLATGSCSIRMLEKLKKEYFGSSLDKLKEELDNMLDANSLAQRRKQIDLCANLDQYHHGADVMLKLRDMYKLKGDFSDLEKVVQSKNKELQLKEIGENILKSAKRIKNIPASHIDCLKAFHQCGDFVAWVRAEVKEKDVNNFVDLASSTLGESDEAAYKIRSLLSALDGYRPLIYHLNENLDYRKFMDLCEKVWNSLKENKNLVQNLRDSAQELEYWKKVKDHFIKVEIHSIDQASSINSTGVFRVGCFLDSKDQNFKTVADIIQLNFEVDEVARRDDDGKPTMKKSNKCYNYADLKDLQSKLALVAGDKRKEKNETILRFNALKDVADNIAQAYLDIRREGCIQFDDLVVFIHCKPEAKFGLELNFKSIHTVLHALNDSNAKVLDHCRHLYTYLNTCVKDWQRSMADKRREFPVLNFYTTEQLVVLRKELGRFSESGRAETLKQSLPLLAMISPVNPELLHQHINNFNSLTSSDEEAMEEDGEKRFISFEEMDDERKDMVTELEDGDEDFTHELAVQAVNELGIVEMDEYWEWVKEHKAKQPSNADEAMRSESKSLHTANEIMLELMHSEPEDSPFQKRLATLWDGFVEHTSKSIRDFLSVDHLAYVLTKIEEAKTNPQRSRNLPEWLERGKPRLLVVPGADTYRLVLTIYQCDPNQGYPTRNEVLICNKSTRTEEVSIFLNRALADPDSCYCMVNCHLLSYEVCRFIENRLSSTGDDKVTTYCLAFLYAEEAKDARIRSYLDKNLVKNVKLAPMEDLAVYVEKLLKLPGSVGSSAALADPNKYVSQTSTMLL